MHKTIRFNIGKFYFNIFLIITRWFGLGFRAIYDVDFDSLFVDSNSVIKFFDVQIFLPFLKINLDVNWKVMRNVETKK